MIKEFVKNIPKRTIKLNKAVNYDITRISYEYSALMTKVIWDSYISSYIRQCKWPVQCKNLNKFLLKDDLATKIELPSIRYELILFYDLFGKCLSTLINSDEEFSLYNNSNFFLAYSNYLLCIDGFERIKRIIEDKEIKIDIKNNNNSYQETEDIINNIIPNKALKQLVKKIRYSKGSDVNE